MITDESTQQGQWERLTPHPDMTVEGFSVFYQSTPKALDAQHELAYGWSNADDCEEVDETGSTLFLTDAELLALVIRTGVWRKVPEVRALVFSVKNHLFSDGTHMELEIELAPFQEDTDADDG